MAASETFLQDKTDGNEEALQNLIKLFGNALDLEIIKSVAFNCQYNMRKTSDILHEMLSGCMPRNQKKEKPKYRCNSKKPAPLQTPKLNDEDVIIDCMPWKRNVNLQLNSTKMASTLPTDKTGPEKKFDEIVQCIQNGSRILILMRGLPGSGKSFLAKNFIDRGLGVPNYNFYILSTDDYFINRKTGVYHYDVSKLQEAHTWNQQRAHKKMLNGISPIIIDNTNLQMWEMKVYANQGVQNGYIIEIVEPLTHWAFNNNILASKNIHGVPKEKIKEMHDRYEKNIRPDHLFSVYDLSYSPPYKPPLKSNVSIAQNKIPDESFVNSNNSYTFSTITNSGNKESNLMVQPYASDTPDLMNFVNVTNQWISNDDVAYSKTLPTATAEVDGILMDTDSIDAEVLQPTIENSQSNYSEPEVIKIFKYSLPSNKTLADSHSFENLRIDCIKKENTEVNIHKNLYPNLNLASWTFPENSELLCESWELNSFNNNQKESKNKEQVVNVELIDNATNTSSSDFALLTNNEIPDKLKILKTNYRDINDNNSYQYLPASPSKKMLLDKGCMTNEDVLVAALSREHFTNEKNQIEELVLLFPHIHTDYLLDVYEKCHKDINWTVDLLLDDNKEILPLTAINNDHTELVDRVYNKENSRNEESSDLLQLSIDELNIESNNCDQTLEHQKFNEFKINNSEIHNDKEYLDEPSTSKIEDSTTLQNFDAEMDLSPDEETEEETVSINLGDTCITQLEALFGIPEMLTQGISPTVNVPHWLAAQLHAFYIESAIEQIVTQNQVLKKIAEEDEELARKLQIQEEMSHLEEIAKIPDLKEIMKEQAASNFYQKQVDEWKNLTPETLASKLTLHKLSTIFPLVDKTLLMEILNAHNNSYKQTIDVLIASTRTDQIYDPDGTILIPPISDFTIEEMKRAEEEKKKNSNIPDERKTANQYREEASMYFKKHKELIRKAQKEYNKKQFLVAQFYTDLARNYTQLFDQANNLAATAFLQEHSESLQSFYTLDLHYLYVKEAIPALDIFLDKNIRLIHGSNKKSANLFIITGRGKGSIQGKPSLKPAVMVRLKKRKLRFSQLNPGLLKVKIYPHSIITNNI